jgi:hypothetical protein
MSVDEWGQWAKNRGVGWDLNGGYELRLVLLGATMTGHKQNS